jgi:hypothetical protein
MRTALAVALGALASFALPSAAGAEIVPQKGIKAIEVDMTVDQVRDAAGSPTRFRTVRDEFVGRTRRWDYGLTTVLFSSTRANATVRSITTRSRAEKTASGVGIGSRRATVKSKVAGARCLVEFTYDHCFLGRFTAGQIVTDFAIDRRGRVSRVTVGRVLD